ncbi:MAG: hypothetical protein NTZ37_05065 [Methanoregula sp.]|nr:hypothetical protein [Methanoregula sp.]
MLSIFGYHKVERRSPPHILRLVSPEFIDLWAAIGVNTVGVHFPDKVTCGFCQCLESLLAFSQCLLCALAFGYIGKKADIAFFPINDLRETADICIKDRSIFPQAWDAI